MNGHHQYRGEIPLAFLPIASASDESLSFFLIRVIGKDEIDARLSEIDGGVAPRLRLAPVMMATLFFGIPTCSFAIVFLILKKDE
jgi:hypothetical protein